MRDIVRTAGARALPAIGERHRVEVASSVPVGPDAIVEFRDLDRPGCAYREAFIGSEIAIAPVGRSGTLTRADSRAVRGGRWVFEPDEQGQGGESSG